MKRLLLFTIMFCSLWASGQNTFVKEMTSASGSFFRTHDGGFLFKSGSQCEYFGGFMYGICKTDGDGEVQWNVSYGDNYDNTTTGVIQTSDQGYAILGKTTGNFMEYRTFLCKTDSVGTIQWIKAYSSPETEYMRDLAQTPDGGYILVGAINNYAENGESDAVAIKTDSLGNMEWNKVYNSSEHENIHRVFVTASGSYVFGGSFALSNSLDDVLAMGVSAQGTVNWARRYRASSDLNILGMISTNDGGYLMNGSLSYTSLNSDPFAMKLNHNGAVEWCRVYLDPGVDHFTDVVQTADSGFAHVGVDKRVEQGEDNDVLLIRTAADGRTRWSREYDDADYQGSQLEGEADGGFTMTAVLSSTGFNPERLIRTDANGNAGCYQRVKSYSDANLPISVINRTYQVSSPFVQNNDQVFLETACSGIPNTPICATSTSPIQASTASTAVSCFGGADGTASATAFNGLEPYTFEWNTIPVQTGDTASALSAGTYMCTITDATGTYMTVNVWVEEPSELEVNMLTQGPVEMCIGDSATLHVAAPIGTSLQWRLNDQPIPDATQSILAVYEPGNYDVQADQNGCSQWSEVIEVVVHSPSADVEENGNLLTCSPANSYQWYFNDTMLAGAIEQSYYILESGNYYVVITDEYGCIDTSYTHEMTNHIGIDESELQHVHLDWISSSDRLRITLETKTTQQLKFVLQDCLGRTLDEKQLKNTVGRIETDFGLSSLSNGVYLLGIYTDTDRYAQKFVVAK